MSRGQAVREGALVMVLLLLDLVISPLERFWWWLHGRGGAPSVYARPPWCPTCGYNGQIVVATRVSQDGCPYPTWGTCPTCGGH